MMDEIQEKTGFGDRLKHARQSMRLSEKEAAARLHLNPSIIHLLEAEAFDNNAPPPTFIRGYLKSYARLLNVSDQEVNVAMDQLGLNPQPAAPVPPMLNASTNLYKSERYVNWITYLIVLVLLVMVGAWWDSGPHTSLQNALNFSSETSQATTHTLTTAVAVPPVTSTATTTTVPVITPNTAPATTTPAPTTLSAVNNTVAAAPAPAAAPPAAPVAAAPAQQLAPPPPPVAITNTPPGSSSLLQPDTALPAGTIATNKNADDAAKHKKSHSEDSGTGMMLPEPGLE